MLYREKITRRTRRTSGPLSHTDVLELVRKQLQDQPWTRRGQRFPRLRKSGIVISIRCDASQTPQRRAPRRVVCEGGEERHALLSYEVPSVGTRRKDPQLRRARYGCGLEVPTTSGIEEARRDEDGRGRGDVAATDRRNVFKP